MPSNEMSTTEPMVSTVADADVQDHDEARRGLWWRRAAVAMIALFVLAGLLNVWGPRQSTVVAEGELHRVEVSVPRVSRGGLASPWRVTVRTLDGGPLPTQIEVAVSQDYFEIFDENAVHPTPTDQWTDGESVRWVFENTSPASEFVVAIDARIQPNRRWRHRGSIEVVAGPDSITAPFTTWLLP